MKKIFTLLVLGLVTVSAFAYNQRSELNLRVRDNSAFCVILDGKKYHLHNNRYRIPNLLPGKHFLKVIKHVDRSNYNRRQNPINVFAGNIFIPKATKLFAVVDYSNRFSIMKRQPMNANYYGEKDRRQYGTNRYYDRHYDRDRCMTGRDFEELKFTLEVTNFDSERLLIAKQAIKASHVKTLQVKQLMNMLTFESNKLKLAKFAYRYTLNKDKYYLVNSALTFSSSIRELNRYVNSFRNSY